MDTNNELEVNHSEDAAKKVIEKLKSAKRKPVLLQGYVQSGKTATYLLTIDMLIKKGYSKFIILTKCSNGLSNQTKDRVLEYFEDREDQIEIFNIRDEYKNFAECQLDKVNIFIIKKHPRDFEKFQQVLNDYSDIRNELGLIIDDESDQASIGFRKEEGETLYRAICQDIIDLREALPRAHFLTVTATPFVHYLSDNILFRPSGVVLLEPHSNYFGGRELFISENYKNKAIRENYFLEEEFNSILEDVVWGDLGVIDKYPKLAEALMNFFVGGCIRHYQDPEAKLKHYSMLVHIDTQKKGHYKQEKIIKYLISNFLGGMKFEQSKVRALFNDCYVGFIKTKSEILPFPSKDELIERVIIALSKQTKVDIINSDNKKGLVFRKGAIKNAVPFSIFIGALAVERGITFVNLISFVFGRASKTVTADSSLQQLRIFGARDPDDLNVTRLYATEKMVDNWRELCKIEEVIRENIELLVETMNTVQTSNYAKNLLNVLPLLKKQMIYTSSSKLPLGQTTFKEYSRILPTAFTTISDDELAHTITNDNLAIIQSLYDKYEIEYLDANTSYITVETDEAIDLILKVYSALQSLESKELFGLELSIFVLKLFKEQNKGKVHLYTKYNRNRKATKKGKNNSIIADNSPDSGKRGDFKKSQEIAQEYPILMLLHQDGKVENGYKDVPFIWPVLCLPKKIDYGLIMRGKLK